MDTAHSGQLAAQWGAAGLATNPLAAGPPAGPARAPPRQDMAPPVPGMGLWSDPDEKPWDSLVVWRVRFWLLALAVGLIAVHSHDVPTQQVAARATPEAGCPAPAAHAGTAARLVHAAWPARQRCSP